MLVTFTKSDGRKATVMAGRIIYAGELIKDEDGVSPGTVIDIVNPDDTTEQIECKEKYADFIKLWGAGLGLRPIAKKKVVKKKAPVKKKVVKKKAPAKKKVIRRKK